MSLNLNKNPIHLDLLDQTTLHPSYDLLNNNNPTCPLRLLLVRRDHL